MTQAEIKIDYMGMSKEQIRREADRLRKKAEECEYYATTLSLEHQSDQKTALEAKAKELRHLQKEYESFL